jgi:fatty-acyl-CoA synthase
MSFLARRAANHAALSPLTFLPRTAAIFPKRVAIAYDDWKGRSNNTSRTPAFEQTWGETMARVTKLASALSHCGVDHGDSVAVLAPNTPMFVEAHHAVNAAGAVINPLNTRLDPATLAYILDHSDCKVLMTDSSLREVAHASLEKLRVNGSAVSPLLVDAEDPIHGGSHAAATAATVGGTPSSFVDYEAFVASGDASFEWRLPRDEWDTQALNYTSGTTGRPKGVLYHHRGAALNAMNNAVTWGMPQHPTYLWTLPMFHCNGWCFPYTVTMLAGTHVCLNAVDSEAIFSAIAATGVTHACGAPVVLSLLTHAPASEQALLALRDESLPPVKMLTAGAPPPAAVIEGIESLGFDITHVYGLTETYGPSVSCPWNAEEWDGLPQSSKAEIKAQQGVTYPNNELCVVLTEAERVDASGLSHEDDRANRLSGAPIPASWRHVPKDGETIGEVMMRGNVVMKGYLKDEGATDAAFEGGWFHSGDLAVVHPNNYVQIKDRAKDIIISGGENIATVEVEGVLFRHPQVLEAAVVARPDLKWGEVPCAFVVLKEGEEWRDDGGEPTANALIAHCRNHMAHFKAPKHVVHMPGGLPKTSTGKVQKFALRDLAKEDAEQVQASASGGCTESSAREGRVDRI